jgi:hypothetical protein
MMQISSPGEIGTPCSVQAGAEPLGVGSTRELGTPATTPCTRSGYVAPRSSAASPPRDAGQPDSGFRASDTFPSAPAWKSADDVHCTPKVSVAVAVTVVRAPAGQ